MLTWIYIVLLLFIIDFKRQHNKGKRFIEQNLHGKSLSNTVIAIGLVQESFANEK